MIAPTSPLPFTVDSTPTQCPACGHEHGGEKRIRGSIDVLNKRPGTMTCYEPDKIQGGFVDFNEKCGCQDSSHG